MEVIPRKDAYVQELCEFTSRRIAELDGDTDAFYASLSDDDEAVIVEEQEKVSDPSPAGVRYFLENYFIINTAEEGLPPRLQSFYPFKECQEVLWSDFVFCWQNELPVFWVLLKARQLGWSTQVQGMIAQRTLFFHHVRSMIIADEKVRSNHIFEMTKSVAFDHLPIWLQPEVQYERTGEILSFNRKDRAERTLRPGLDSIIYVDAANKPSGSGRGMSFHNLHASEVSRYKDLRILTMDILPAVNKSANRNTVCVVEGTAEGRGYGYHRLWQAAVDGKTRFRPVFAAWWLEKSYSKPFANTVEKDAFFADADEVKLAAKVKDEFGYELTKEQLAWRRREREQVAALAGDADDFEQEYPSYPEAAWRAKGRTAFDKKKLSLIEVADVRKPIWAGEIAFIQMGEGKVELPKWIAHWSLLMQDGDETRIATAPLWIWEFPQKEGPTKDDTYYLAGDPAMGIPGADFSALSVWRVPKNASERIRQVAEFRGYVSVEMLAKLTNYLGRYYHTCQIAPECNTLTLYIGSLRGTYNYPNIYRWRRPDKQNVMTTFFGWETNAKSRENLINRFRTLMMEDSVQIKSQRLLDECYTFVDADLSGRYEAEGDNHDDALFAAMIAVYCTLELDPWLAARQAPELPKDTSVDFYNTDATSAELHKEIPVDQYDYDCL